eukprot:CAMPEP_0117451758 /NCGR_PEP_ID=MMETSP0759-20121206/9187_1 /TAXON_ID=63605 /ORGANISM="Percolomonas cosmopolitus, Strain WS" /LENGTH=1164 /DNA_ID=CAMNT_0005244397 /DNA_START=330 /DNA_END=3824 /DNA_ORIENTATION=+
MRPIGGGVHEPTRDTTSTSTLAESSESAFIQKTWQIQNNLSAVLQKTGFHDFLGNLNLDLDNFKRKYVDGESGKLVRSDILFFVTRCTDSQVTSEVAANSRLLITFTDPRKYIDVEQIKEIYLTLKKLNAARSILILTGSSDADNTLTHLADTDDATSSISAANASTSTQPKSALPTEQQETTSDFSSFPASLISLQALNALALLEEESNVIIKLFHERDLLDASKMDPLVDWIQDKFLHTNSTESPTTPTSASNGDTLKSAATGSHHRIATATISVKGKPHKIISTIQMKGMNRNHFGNPTTNNRKRKNFQTKIRDLLKGKQQFSPPKSNDSLQTADSSSSEGDRERPEDTVSNDSSEDQDDGIESSSSSPLGEEIIEEQPAANHPVSSNSIQSSQPQDSTTTVSATTESNTKNPSEQQGLFHCTISIGRTISMLNRNYIPFADCISNHYNQHLAHIPKIAPPTQSIHPEEEINMLIDHFQHHVSPPAYLKLSQLHAFQSKNRSEKKIVHNFQESLHEPSCNLAKRDFLRAKWKCSGRTINSRERRLKRMRRAATRGDAKAQLWLCRYLDDEYWEARDKKTQNPPANLNDTHASTAAADKKQLRKEEFWHWLWHAAWNGEPWAFCRIAWALENGDDAPEYIWKIDTDELRRRFLFAPMASNIDEEEEGEDHESHSMEASHEMVGHELPQSISPPADTHSQQQAGISQDSSISTVENDGPTTDQLSAQNKNKAKEGGLSSAASLVADRLRRAVTLYELASSLNYNRGHYLLARCLKNLIGISKLDLLNGTQVLQRALDLLHFAASNSYAPAMNDLACLLIEADPKKAFELFQEASNLGLRAASFNLGACLLNGIGTKVNLGKALTHFDWYHWKEGQISDDILKKRVLLTDHELEMVAAEAFHQVALRYFNGNHVRMDKVKAAYYFEKSARKGNMNSQYKLALCYANGEGVPQDREEACYWYRKSAQSGHRESLNNLGVCLRSGIGCEKNEAEAVKCYKLASEKKNRIAAANLASCYENGIGVERDEAKAFYWYEQSAQLGYPKGLCALASYYENGIACAKDIKKAKQLYLKAAELGYAKAYHCLGVLHNKLGLISESFAFFEKASRGGYAPSKTLLERHLMERNIIVKNREAQQEGDAVEVEESELSSVEIISEIDSQEKSMKE